MADSIWKPKVEEPEWKMEMDNHVKVAMLHLSNNRLILKKVEA